MLTRKKIILLFSSIVLLISGCSNLLTIPKGEWLKLGETDHFIYYSLAENQLTQDEVNNALQRLEEFWDEVAPVWAYPGKLKVRYFKFKNRDQVKELTGRYVNGKAILSENIVHSIQFSDAHEVAHLFSTQHVITTGDQVKIANFWLEGIAMYYTWPWVYFGKDHPDLSIKKSIGVWGKQTVHHHAQTYLNEASLPKLTPLIYKNYNFDDLDDQLSYTTAGSFITYLVGESQSDLEGLQKYKELLYRLNQCNSEAEVLTTFHEIFGKPFTVAEAEWIEYLKTWDETTVN